MKATHTQNRVIIAAILVGLSFNVIATQVECPLVQVQKTSERILTILNDAALKGETNKAERERLICQELRERFDWRAISRGCLGHHWTQLSTDQRTEFQNLFERFLERTYLDRIEPYYTDLDKVTYQGEKIIGSYASVKCSIVTRQKIDHPVEYRLEKSPTNDWRVYDIVIEGVSLVGNYRTQFNEIITRSSYQALLNDILLKIEARAN